jgi:predicted HTH transcriptional regulator
MCLLTENRVPVRLNKHLKSFVNETWPGPPEIAPCQQHLVGAAHALAQYKFQVTPAFLASVLRVSEATAKRYLKELVERGHVGYERGRRGRSGLAATNRYPMIIKDPTRWSKRSDP